MNRPSITSRLTLSLSTLMLALLTACGGGGGGGGDTYGNVGTVDDGGPLVGGTDPTAQPAAATAVCGILATPVSVATGAEQLDITYDLTTEINGFEVPMRLITSLTGYPYDIGVQSLSLPMEDLRSLMDGYTPGNAVGSMGVEMDSRFAAASVGCINGVSRAINNNTEASPNYLMSWISAMLTDLPMGSVPGAPINGFEYTHNFTDKPATAVFRIGKGTLASTSSAQICHIKANSSVDCVVPEVIDDGAQWTLKRSASESGVYVLSAEQETVQHF